VIEPLVSVLMPVYNAEKYLSEAIDSIINQTFKNFEFLIINDGSTDNSLNIIKGFDDARVRLIDHPKNMGLVASLNEGLKIAAGQFIARMDADDISDTDRLQTQVDLLLANPDISLVGCHMDIIDEQGTVIGKRKYQTSHDAIKVESLFRCPVPHPGIMLRKDSFVNNNLFYNPSFSYYAEDYELWQRALSILKFANANTKLLQYRITSNQNSNLYATGQKTETDTIRSNYLKELGLKDNDCKLLLNFLDGQLTAQTLFIFAQILILIQQAINTNKTVMVFNQALIGKVFSKRLDQFVRVYTTRNNKLYSAYKISPMFGFTQFNLLDKFKVSLKEWIRS
jgi:glycosyltransferase involved in cell wall biosynthesis